MEPVPSLPNDHPLPLNNTNSSVVDATVLPVPFSLPTGFLPDLCLTDAYMRTIPTEVWLTLLSHYLSVELTRGFASQRAVQVFPCVCRLWNQIESQHMRLWPTLLQRDFAATNLLPFGKLNPFVKARNRDQAIYLVLLSEKFCGSGQKKRIMKELRDFRKDKPHDLGLRPVEPNNHTLWEAKLRGDLGSHYAGGVFLLSVEFPKDYPFKPPKIRFKTKIYHPNINRNGILCLDVLSYQWSPALTISRILCSISALLYDVNPDDPLEPDIALVYKTNRTKYNATCAEWVKLYASDDPKPTEGEDYDFH